MRFFFYLAQFLAPIIGLVGIGMIVIGAKTRSMMNLSMIGALGKMHEWELHCR